MIVPTWEYLVVDLAANPDQRIVVLSRWGAEGWELVTLSRTRGSPDLMVFKRMAGEIETRKDELIDETE